MCVSVLTPAVKPADGVPCISTVNLMLREASDLVQECGTVIEGCVTTRM